MSQLIRKMLATAEKRKELLGIYTNYQDSTKFAAGYILASDDQFVLLGHIDHKGNYDGYIVKSGYPFRSAQLKVRIKGQAKDYTVAMKRKSEGLRHVYWKTDVID